MNNVGKCQSRVISGVWMHVRELIFVIFLTLAKLNPVASPQGTLSHFIASTHLPKRKKEKPVRLRAGVHPRWEDNMRVEHSATMKCTCQFFVNAVESFDGDGDFPFH
ncbi:unnamed protein product [Larinioides sclopetarius]|uniref:Secreted protein n=1 Tax=Larinioides sclopetarius TaxID=280406 RepID=A0AAV1YYP7_9ARAC